MLSEIIYVFSVILALLSAVDAFYFIVDDINHLPKDEWLMIMSITFIFLLILVFLPIVNTFISIKYIYDRIK